MVDSPLCIFIYWSMCVSEYFPVKGCKGRSFSDIVQASLTYHRVLLIMILCVLILVFSVKQTLWHLIARHKLCWVPQFVLALSSIRYCCSVAETGNNSRERERQEGSGTNAFVSERWTSSMSVGTLTRLFVAFPYTQGRYLEWHHDLLIGFL
jgi:hypothetical protein